MWPLPELVSQASATGPMSQHIHGVLDTLSSQSCDTSRPEETVPSGAFDRCSDGDADQIHVGSSMTCDRSGSRETLPHDSNQRAFRCSPDPCIWANAPESVQYTPVLCRTNPVNPLLYTQTCFESTKAESNLLKTYESESLGKAVHEDVDRRHIRILVYLRTALTTILESARSVTEHGAMDIVGPMGKGSTSDPLSCFRAWSVKCT
jgi:hypothetical protein